MQIVDENIRTTSKIFFKQSVKDILQRETSSTIKEILNVIDVIVENPDERSTIRKVVLDAVNEYHRTATNIVASLVEIKNDKV